MQQIDVETRMMFSERLTKIKDAIMPSASVADFRRFLGVSNDSTVHNYLNGVVMPPTHMLARIAKACNVSADWLLGLSDHHETLRKPVSYEPEVARWLAEEYRRLVCHGLTAVAAQFLRYTCSRKEAGRINETEYEELKEYAAGLNESLSATRNWDVRPVTEGSFYDAIQHRYDAIQHRYDAIQHRIKPGSVQRYPADGTLLGDGGELDAVC